MASACELKRSPALAKLIGDAPEFLRAIGQIPAIAASGAAVLIAGETGTGKELVAHAIHYLSPQASFPFVAVNCGSLPDTLLEDELFGHERGAFTSAEARREGLVAQAEKGTLFLDEVDTLAPKAQVDLLRVLQDQKYRMIGGNREREANVRILAGQPGRVASRKIFIRASACQRVIARFRGFPMKSWKLFALKVTVWACSRYRRPCEIHYKPSCAGDLVRRAALLIGEDVLGRVGRDIAEATGLSGFEFGVLSRRPAIGKGEMRQQTLARVIGWDKRCLSHQLTRNAGTSTQ